MNAVIFSKLIDAKLTIEAGKSSDQNSTERRGVVQLHFNKIIRNRSSAHFCASKATLTRSSDDSPMTSKDKNMRCIYIYTYMNMSIKQKRLLAVLLKLTMFPWQEEVPFTRFGFVAHPTRCQRGFPQGKLQKRRSGRFRQRRLQPSHLGC